MAAGYVQKVFALCYVTSFDEVRTQWSAYNRPGPAISLSPWWKNLFTVGEESPRRRKTICWPANRLLLLPSVVPGFKCFRLVALSQLGCAMHY